MKNDDCDITLCMWSSTHGCRVTYGSEATEPRTEYITVDEARSEFELMEKHWQPIKTAKLDSKFIYARDKDNRRIVVVNTLDSRGQLIWRGRSHNVFVPTHWIPLPYPQKE